MPTITLTLSLLLSALLGGTEPAPRNFFHYVQVELNDQLLGKKHLEGPDTAALQLEVKNFHLGSDTLRFHVAFCGGGLDYAHVTLEGNGHKYYARGVDREDGEAFLPVLSTRFEELSVKDLAGMPHTYHMTLHYSMHGQRLSYSAPLGSITIHKFSRP